MATAESSWLLALFNHIHSLSADLKKLSASHQEQQKVLLGARTVLQTLAADGPQTVPAIAELRNTSRQNIQIIADRQAELGCIEFVPNPRHKRSELLRLTEKGKAVLAASSEHETGILKRLSNRLSEAETQVVIAFLNRIRSLLAEDGQGNGKALRVASTAEETQQARKLGGRRGAVSKTSAAASRSQHQSVSGASRPPAVTTQSPQDDESLPVNLL